MLGLHAWAACLGFFMTLSAICRCIRLTLACLAAPLSSRSVMWSRRQQWLHKLAPPGSWERGETAEGQGPCSRVCCWWERGETAEGQGLAQGRVVGGKGEKPQKGRALLKGVLLVDAFHAEGVEATALERRGCRSLSLAWARISEQSGWIWIDLPGSGWIRLDLA